MKFSTQYVLAGLAAMGLFAAAESAQALDLNGKGSSAGRNFAADVPAGLCDVGPATYYFQLTSGDTAATGDPNAPATRSEWRCNRGGVATVYRYHGTNSLDGFTSLNNTNVLLNTAGYLDTASASCVASTFLGANPVTFKGHANTTVMACPSSPTLLTNLPIHYGASDEQSTSFTQSGFGVTVTPPTLISGINTVPVNTVPFAVAVGGDVLNGAGGAPIDSLSMADLQQIFAGTVTTWTALGYDTATANKNITVCHRTPGSGTLATLDQTIMKKGPRAINGTRVPASGPPVAGAYANIGNAGSGNMVDCLANRLVLGVPQNPNFRNAIGYIDSDSIGLISGAGARYVKIDGNQVFDAAQPASNGAARLKDLRCGRYVYQGNWNLVIRDNVDGLLISGGGTVPAGTQTLLDDYFTLADATNPLVGFWALDTDMLVSKNADQGPLTEKPGAAGVCHP